MECILTILEFRSGQYRNANKVAKDPQNGCTDRQNAFNKSCQKSWSSTLNFLWSGLAFNVTLCISKYRFKLLGYSADGETALKEILVKEPDIAILDIEMPVLNGIEVAKKLIENQSKTKVVFFTLYNERSFFLRAMDLGVRGYLLKDSAPEEIISCIDTVHKSWSIKIFPYMKKTYLGGRGEVKGKLFWNLFLFCSQ